MTGGASKEFTGCTEIKEQEMKTEAIFEATARIFYE